MKRLLSLFMVLIFAFSLLGCSASEEEYDIKIYYVSTDKTKIVGVNYNFESITISAMIREAINKLSSDTGEVEYMRTIPAGITVDEWEINDGNLSLYFSGDYSSMETVTEVLVRSALVKTLVQIEGVDSVSIYVNNSPLMDTTGSVIGTMTADMFIDDFGEETDSLLSSTLTLYFASADGKSIVAETREVYYSRNVALEKLVIEQLLKGPDSENLLSTIPSETKLVSVSVVNGVCYVNFDAAFETSILGVTENATIYSIVDSLTELDNILEVQFLVNGETPSIPNLDVDLSTPVTRNTDIINTVTESDYNFISDVYDIDEDEDGEIEVTEDSSDSSSENLDEEDDN